MVSDLCADALGAGEAQHFAGLGDALLDGLALILLSEGVARDHDAADLVDAPFAALAGGERAQHPALVEHEADIGAVRAIRQSRDHGFGIGHLRHAGGVDEARDLEPPRAVADHAVD